MKQENVALRKRSQIAQANRTMFLWIAIASALVGAAIVVSYFFAKTLIYNEKVLAAKQATVSTLVKNNAVVEDLETAIKVLDTNSSLASIKANSDDQAIQVILDALPSEANSFALGASLQTRLIESVDGINLITLQVDPVVGVETNDAAAASGDAAAGEITFQFIVEGNQQQIRAVLENLERSIRTVVVSSMTIDSQESGLQQLTVRGKAFYEPEKKVELTEKAVPR